jgi:hypothetical protein
MRRSVFSPAALSAALLAAAPLAVSAQTTRADSAAGRLDVSMQPTLTTVMTALTATDSNMVRLATATTLTPDSIMLVDVTPLVTPADSATFSAAISANQKQIMALREALVQHAALQGVLSSRQVPLAQVIAVDVAGDGRRAWVLYRPMK